MNNYKSAEAFKRQMDSIIQAGSSIWADEPPVCKRRKRAVAEETCYMPDYICDRQGNVKEIVYDYVRK